MLQPFLAAGKSIVIHVTESAYCLRSAAVCGHGFAFISVDYQGPSANPGSCRHTLWTPDAVEQLADMT